MCMCGVGRLQVLGAGENAAGTEGVLITLCRCWDLVILHLAGSTCFFEPYKELTLSQGHRINFPLFLQTLRCRGQLVLFSEVPGKCCGLAQV